MWHRDHAQKWRDVRLSAYEGFLSAYRALLAYILDPGSIITAVPHPTYKGDMMPYFDESGRSYREKLEAARMTVFLVTESPETIDAARFLMRRVRNLAGLRAEYEPSQIPENMFRDLFDAHDAFTAAARSELGLSTIPNLNRSGLGGEGGRNRLSEDKASPL
jgi:hypothetical protein